jgi:YVTN family beta-propeller protein
MYVGSGPAGIAYSPVNHNIYVSCCGYNIVSVVNSTSNTVNDTVFVGICPIGIAYDSFNHNIYVSNPLSGTISILSLGKYLVYQVIFTESGLPAGTIWYLNVTGIETCPLSGPMTNLSYYILLSNGTYLYSTATKNIKYAPAQSNATFEVNGASLSIAIIFSQIPPPPPVPPFVYIIIAAVILIIIAAALIPREDFKRNK